jgi:hypothetical protein
MGDLNGGGSDPVDFAGTMAEAIETELNFLLHHDGKTELPADGSTDAAKDRRRFIAAIARGVIDHLRDNPDAFQVIFTQVPSPHSISDFRAHVQVHGSNAP